MHYFRMLLQYHIFIKKGPGNFRDILQNRRNDVFFNPRIGAFNVKVFLSYIQADGYNPLTVEATVFMIHDRQQCDRLATLAVGSAVGKKVSYGIAAMMFRNNLQNFLS